MAYDLPQSVHTNMSADLEFGVRGRPTLSAKERLRSLYVHVPQKPGRCDAEQLYRHDTAIGPSRPPKNVCFVGDSARN